MYIAFDIGGTTIKYGVVSSTGDILEKDKLSTPMSEVDFLSKLTDIVKKYQSNYDDIQGIGISAPGVVSETGVMTLFGALTELYGMPLQARLTELTGLPVAIENDANAAAIAEHWLGGAQDLKDYITIVVGTGLGGGIVQNGQVYRGAHGAAGELGWPLYHGRNRAGNLESCSETFYSPTVLGLMRRYNEALTSLHQEETSDTRAVLALAEAGDPTAFNIFDEYIGDLAQNLLNLTAVYDPEAILIGGGISENPYFMDMLTARFDAFTDRHEAMSRLKSYGLLGEIRKAKLGNDAGMLGAAYIIKTKLSK
ncbi:MAG: ROK family protein [Streptococcaceae bacterium]|nr:ROK family protein [Streptococcaceae bacterium]